MGQRVGQWAPCVPRQTEPPAHRRGDVVAVRVHPEQLGVVVIVDDEPTASPPAPLRRPVPEYSGVPAHTRGTVLSELAATMLMLGAMVVGIVVPIIAFVLVEPA